jgi:hypothetical protein
MRITIGKMIALLIAVGYIAAAVVAEHGFTGNVLKGCAVLVLPMVLIWFPEELGGLTGFAMRGATVDTETPQVLISVMGWFFLIGLPVIAYFVLKLS